LGVAQIFNLGFRRFPIGKVLVLRERSGLETRDTAQRGGAAPEEAQISNLLYRRFPIGKRLERSETLNLPSARRLEALRYSRLEICATGAPENSRGLRRFRPILIDWKPPLRPRHPTADLG